MAGIYVHIPFCKSRCIYCGFFSTTSLHQRHAYVDAVVEAGTFIQDGVISDAGTNLMCVIMLFVMAVELFVKDRIDSKKAVEEESGE